MTRRFQILTFVAAIIAGPVAVESLSRIAPAVAQSVAQDAGVPAAPAPAVTTTTVDTPAATVTVTETVLPQVDNPVTNPGAAFDDLRAAKKLGWPALVIVALTALFLGLGTAFPALAKGTTAFILACGTAGLLAAGNTVLAQGSWMAVATAGLLAGFGVWKANREQAARDRAAKDASKAAG